MKILLLTGMLAAATGAIAQDTSGVIEYELTSRVEFGNMLTMRSVNGVVTSSSGGDAGGIDLPDVITTKQVFSFSNGKGKIEMEGGPGGFGSMASAPMITMSAVAAGSGAAMPVTPPPSAMKTFSFAPPITSAIYIDLDKKKFLNLLNEKKDSAVINTWYAEEGYNTSGTFKPSSKTKTIAGYKCKRATAKLGEEVFTVWYTEDLPIIFSPVNGVLPEKGVILSIESSKRSYVAKTVNLKPVAGADVSLPANAQKITSEELKEKRRQILERFQNEQFRKFQTQAQ